MEMLQGNTYGLPVRVEGCDGDVIKAGRVVKGEFVFGDLYKYYGDGGEVVWNDRENAFIVPLTEEDTFSLEGAVECQVRLVLDDGSVSGSVPEWKYVYASKSKTRLTEGGAGEESGELLTIKLLKEIGGGGVTSYPDLDDLPSINGVELVGNKTAEELGIVSEESDPTVPQYIKDITQQNIVDWNNKANKNEIPTKVSQLQNDSGYIKKIPDEYITETELNSKGYVNGEMLEDALKDKATTGYVDKKVTELIGTAPEIHDTLGEISKSIQENESIIDTLNNAIVNKADKSDIPTDISQLNNDVGFITADDIPEVDLDNFYTKDESYSRDEIDAMFGGDSEELLKAVPIITEAKDATAEDPYPQVEIYLKDADGNDYCPAVEIGKTYVVEYEVDGIKYTREDTAIDFRDLGNDIPNEYMAYSLGIKISGDEIQPVFDFITTDGRSGALTINGVVNDNVARVQVMADGSVPSVKIFSLKEAGGGAKYFTKEETKAYVQDQIALAVTDVLNTEV